MVNFLLDLLRLVFNTVVIEVTRSLVKHPLAKKGKEKTVPRVPKRKDSSLKK